MPRIPWTSSRRPLTILLTVYVITYVLSIDTETDQHGEYEFLEVPSDLPIPPLLETRDDSISGKSSRRKDDDFPIPAPPIVPPPPPSLEGNTNALLQLAIFNTMTDKESMKTDTDFQKIDEKCFSILTNKTINGIKLTGEVKAQIKDKHIFVCSKGEKGDPGETGRRGAKGEQGTSMTDAPSCDCKIEFHKMWIERKRKKRLKKRKGKKISDNDIENRISIRKGRRGMKGNRGAPGIPGPALLHFEDGYSMQTYSPTEHWVKLEGTLAYRTDVKKLYLRDDIGWRSIRTSSCGDGILDEHDGEQCDDGNHDNDDQCAGCKKAICGDGFIYRRFEECDGKNFNGRTCSTFRRGMVGTLRCTKYCRISYSRCNYKNNRKYHL